LADGGHKEFTSRKWVLRVTEPLPHLVAFHLEDLFSSVILNTGNLEKRSEASRSASD
jgi:hypothetical protein